jgi:hypothetical protein
VTDPDALILGLYQRRAQRLLQLDGWSDEQIAFLRKIETRRITLPDPMIAMLLKMERMVQTQRTPDPMP